ncbi:MAG: hypothetical protein QOK31_417 [Solirubrobacteraceae bacterium]|jgi:AcrR family transcriptional regulator|nr:hypothetical protein [Solirubrobacteraceae bacterium]
MAEPSSRDRMIKSATLLMRERGVEGTSLSDVLAHSGAPRGSIYHHFPGGKAELIEEATRYGGHFVAARLDAAIERGDPHGSLDNMALFWRRVLGKSDFAAGCPIAAATLGAAQNSPARDAAGVAFASWTDRYGELLRRSGMPPARAESLATLVFAAIEGAVILARAQHSMDPLERTVSELHDVLTEALGDGS